MNTKDLIRWFQREKREMPWREDPTPYQVWVSEVMLQQTQVAVVIPYYERWMAAFPTVEALAMASIEEVIKLWEGLGYYSRARNLHAGAQLIVQDFGGQFPDTAEDLVKIKGLGPYTIGAVLSFAFHQRAAAVDGNVMRVLARYCLIEDDISKAKTQKQIRELAEELLPLEESWVFSEALIELGATVCKKKAECGECPLKRGCLAFRHGKTEDLPRKEKRVAITPLYREVPILRHGEDFLIRKVEQGKIMSDLHEFPFFETTEGGMTVDQLLDAVEKKFDITAEYAEPLAEVKHSFTRYRARLRPSLLLSSVRVERGSYQWVSKKELTQLPFSAGHRRILAQLT